MKRKFMVNIPGESQLEKLSWPHSNSHLTVTGLLLSDDGSEIELEHESSS